MEAEERHARREPPTGTGGCCAILTWGLSSQVWFLHLDKNWGEFKFLAEEAWDKRKTHRRTQYMNFKKEY